jgi:hypothetical protein
LYLDNMVTPVLIAFVVVKQFTKTQSIQSLLSLKNQPQMAKRSPTL